ncbi:hypothetical protein [Hyphomonas sp.]|uniref:hypothetical protein n=1 Tax=Hyphomonas sp. TaxID=87 RepID=UPI0032EEB91A
MFRAAVLAAIAIVGLTCACAQGLLSETFQDGNAAGWNGEPGRGDIRLTEYAGNISLRLQRDASATIRLAASPGHYTISSGFAADNLEGKDGCVLEASVSDGDWIELGRISDGQDDAISLHTVSATVDVPADQLTIRIRADANAANDTCWADNVRVVKSPDTGTEAVSDLVETPAWLLSGTQHAEPFSTAQFAPSERAIPNDSSFEGRLAFQPVVTPLATRILTDRFSLMSRTETPLSLLPEIATGLVQDEERLLPAKRGLVLTDDPYWDYILTPGRVWREPDDEGWSRAALPFALVEKNANCVHNGLLTFGFKDDGSVTPAAWQVGSETCSYFQFDAWGIAPTKYAPGDIIEAAAIKSRDVSERSRRLPLRPISALSATYPHINTPAFGAAEDVAPSSMTLFGLVAEGTHYVGGCETRYGPYPYCDELVIPSYSFAKSLFGGLALMRLEQLYPGGMQEHISDYVPACASSGTWDDVTFENALDMATGHYQSVEPEADEDAAVDQDFFLVEGYSDKIELSCTQYPYRAAPGKQWVYHTSDTFLLGAAMQAFLEARQGPDADIYHDLLVDPVWKPLGLSATLDETRRTNDEDAQPFTGWGLFLQRGDLARLLDFLGRENGQIDGVDMFAPAPLAAALQMVPSDRGLPAPAPPVGYNNGFWSWDIQSYGRCDTSVAIPFMSGFGGLAAVMVPNGTAYYYVSDGGAYAWARAALATESIAPFCKGSNQ